ncbi:MAG: hypothetical protein ACFNP4_02965 [Capnocytophaga gingivalis]|uniref:hypothetical protein n=1 Tax=Capnocytophaga gingivalis TaxID=1017 RepID=UPI00361DC755
MDFWEKAVVIVGGSLTILGVLFKTGRWVYSIFDKQKGKISKLEKKVIKVEAEMDLLKQILPTLNQIIEDYNKKRKK